jgi:hypothetical protein
MRGRCAFPSDPGARVCGCTPKAFWSVRSGERVFADHCGQCGVGLHRFAKGVFGGGGFLRGRHRTIRTRRAWLPSKKSTVFQRVSGLRECLGEFQPIRQSWSKKENGSSKSFPPAAPVKAIQCASDVTPNKTFLLAQEFKRIGCCLRWL